MVELLLNKNEHKTVIPYACSQVIVLIPVTAGTKQKFQSSIIGYERIKPITKAKTNIATTEVNPTNNFSIFFITEIILCYLNTYLKI